VTVTPALTVEGLHKAFGGVVAVRDVTLQAPYGEVTGLIGPNGSGKSTVMNLIGGQLRIDSGRVLVGDVDVTTMTPERRSALGVARMFQQPRLVDELGPLDNIALGSWVTGRGWARALSPRRWRRAKGKAREVAAELGISHLLTRRTRDLSHVERRMIEMARVLASGAKLLLLDEPMAGLDRREKELFAETTKALRGPERAVLIVEHDVALMRGLCDGMYCLAQGEVIAAGGAHDVVGAPEVRALYVGKSMALEHAEAKAR
jgi:ABC-type branched-subunit amino acid transport system ATPase component